MGIIIAILALSFLIIIHELGHFLVAKAFKVRVNEFSLFMGPKLWSFQKGETQYSLRLIPMGGYVKMEGEEEASEDDRAYNKKPIGVRMAIIAAGPIMNILVALIFGFIIVMNSGYVTKVVESVKPGSVAEQVGIKAGDKFVKYNDSRLFMINDVELLAYPLGVNDPVTVEIERNGKTQTIDFTPDRNGGYKLGFTPKAADGSVSREVQNVASNSAAYKAGLKVDDKILKLNDITVNSRQDIAEALNSIKGNKVTITVERDGQKLSLEPVIPEIGKNPEIYSMGLTFGAKESGIADGIVQSVNYNLSLSRSIFISFSWLFQKVVPTSDMMGPIGITTTISDTVAVGESFTDKLINLLSITTLISINLGLLNLFPFPALDGSKIVLLAVEGIRKKPLAPEKEAIITMVGFVLLIMLLVYASFNDIVRIVR